MWWSVKVSCVFRKNKCSLAHELTLNKLTEWLITTLKIRLALKCIIIWRSTEIIWGIEPWIVSLWSQALKVEPLGLPFMSLGRGKSVKRFTRQEMAWSRRIWWSGFIPKVSKYLGVTLYPTLFSYNFNTCPWNLGESKCSIEFVI